MCVRMYVSTDTKSRNVCPVLACRWRDSFGHVPALDMDVRLSEISKGNKALGRTYIDILNLTQSSIGETCGREACILTRPCLNEILYSLR